MLSTLQQLILESTASSRASSSSTTRCDAPSFPPTLIGETSATAAEHTNADVSAEATRVNEGSTTGQEAEESPVGTEAIAVVLRHLESASKELDAICTGCTTTNLTSYEPMLIDVVQDLDDLEILVRSTAVEPSLAVTSAAVDADVRAFQRRANQVKTKVGKRAILCSQRESRRSPAAWQAATDTPPLPPPSLADDDGKGYDDPDANKLRWRVVNAHLRIVRDRRTMSEPTRSALAASLDELANDVRAWTATRNGNRIFRCLPGASSA